MAWTVEEVDKFKKGLTEEEKAQWVKIANETLQTQLDADVPLLEAEVVAIRRANSLFTEGSQKGLSFSEFKAMEELIFAEVGGVDEQEWQLVAPIGTTYDSWYGEIIFTKNFMQAMLDNQHVMKNTAPFLNEGHDRGRAFGWAHDLRVTDDGLEVKWKFTPKGKQAILDEEYKYYSAEIFETRDIDTGEYVYPTFRGAALTNSPVMKGMPTAHLSEDKRKSLAQGPNDEGEENMDFSKLKEETLKLSDSEKSELAAALGFENRDDEVVMLGDKVTALTESVNSYKEQNQALSGKLQEVQDAKVEAILSEAIEGGKITPADKDKWKERLDKDFEFFADTINDLPASKILDDPKGTGQDDEDGVDLSEKAGQYVGKTNARRMNNRRKAKETEDGSDE